LIFFFQSLHFLLIIKSKPRLVFFDSTSFFKIPFLNKLSNVVRASKKIEKIEKIIIIKLLVIE